MLVRYAWSGWMQTADALQMVPLVGPYYSISQLQDEAVKLATDGLRVFAYV